ncbi:hypothetical protein ACE193_15200 [Bernardetia sp. OM2101]|uniref:hypothetical protein n=1 Tax=Bernardetia sp. OM2101 TaxID=3344876 RepID=UPI0035CF47C2
MALQQQQQQLLFQKVAKIKIDLAKINNTIKWIRTLLKSQFLGLFLSKKKVHEALEITQEVSGIADILTETGGLESARAVLNKCVELGGFDEALDKLNAIEIPSEDVTASSKKKTTTKKK